MTDGDEPSDTMRGRVPGSRIRVWLLMDANRWLVAAVLVLAVFGAIVVVGAVDPSPFRGDVSNKDPVETLFQAFVTAIITGVTLVVTINQLVLSQELGAVGDQRDRMEGAMSFRSDVEDLLDAPVSPPEPAQFLQALVEETRDRASTFADAVEDSTDETLREHADDYVDSLTDNADEVADRLDGAEFGTFDVVSAALNYNYSWKIYEARRLRSEHADALSGEAEDALDSVVSALELFGPAREHVKTLYFQWELINLSRTILYASVPALAVTAAVVLYLDAPAVTGATFGLDNLVWVVSLATAVAVTPFMLLLAYVLRIATVAKRTLSIGPFILRDRERTADVDWE
ncbi:hypothetical protein ACFQH6_16775 [Halobacteriaceae archaeon GCM10025711]